MTACSTIRVTTDLVCYWHEPPLPNEETKEWLATLDWPPGMFIFMEDVGDDKENHQENCNAEH